MGEPKLAFWLRGDDQRFENREVGAYPVFRATILYSLIYEPTIVVSDSDAINGLCFRHALAHDDSFRQMLIDGYIRIARRKHHYRHPSLIDTLQEFIAGNKRPRHFPQREYEDFRTLEVLEKQVPNALFVEYPIDRIARHFTGESRRLFAERHGRQRLGDDVAEFIVEQIDHQAATSANNATVAEPLRGTIGLNFLYYECDSQGSPNLGANLNKKFGPGTWIEGDKSNDLVHVVRQIGDAAYLTGLPTLTDSNPLYAEDQKPAVELWRTRIGSEYDAIDACELNSGLDVATYVAGVNKLTPDRLHELRETPQWAEYKAILDRGVANEGEVRELHRAFAAYRLTVESRICDWLDISAGKPQPTGTIATSVERARDRIPWVRHKILDYGLGKLPFAEHVKLALDMFQPLGHLRASQPQDAAVLDKIHRIEQRRNELHEAEARSPEGTLRFAAHHHRQGGRRLELDAVLPPEAKPPSADANPSLRDACI